MRILSGGTYIGWKGVRVERCTTNCSSTRRPTLAPTIPSQVTRHIFFLKLGVLNHLVKNKVHIRILHQLKWGWVYDGYITTLGDKEIVYYNLLRVGGNPWRNFFWVKYKMADIWRTVGLWVLGMVSLCSWLNSTSDRPHPLYFKGIFNFSRGKIFRPWMSLQNTKFLNLGPRTIKWGFFTLIFTQEFIKTIPDLPKPAVFKIFFDGDVHCYALHFVNIPACAYACDLKMRNS